MKVLLIGPMNSIHLARWANALVASHEVHIATLHIPDGQSYDERIVVHTVGAARTMNYFLAAPKLRRLIRRLRPDIVHINYATGYGTLGRLALRGNSVPVALSVWGSDVFEAPQLGRAWGRLVRANLRRADVVTSSSHAMAREVAALIPAKRIEVIPFGIDTDTFAPDRGPCDGVLRIGTVKSLSTTYGIDTLLRAFALVRDEVDRPTRLLLYGGGPDRADLEKLARSLGIAEDVTFVGHIAHECVPEALHNLDIYVALSRAESFGVAILEAGACGVPVVVSDAEGPTEVTIHERTGFVVPKDDPAAAARALIVLARDANLRQTMGSAAREHVVREYSWPHSVAMLNRLYDELVAPRR